MNSSNDPAAPPAQSSETPAEREFYIVNLTHLHRSHLYVTVWRPEDCGYAWPLSWAGRYPESQVRANLGYYNSGSNVAVPCEVLDALAVAPEKGYIDGDAGPVVPSNAENWNLILSKVIAPPGYRMVPVYPGARGRKPMAFLARTKRRAAFQPVA